MNPQDPLAQLRDIHLPDPVGIWPLAPGWWVLIFLFVGLVGFGIYWLFKKIRSNRYRKQALSLLDGFYAQYQESGNALNYLQNASELLKQVAIKRFNREHTAGLQGNDWLIFLDATLAKPYQKNNSPFTRGDGQQLITLPYQASVNTDLSALHAVMRFWIANHTQIQKSNLRPNNQEALHHAAV